LRALSMMGVHALHQVRLCVVPFIMSGIVR
jgi:hypothetical protein